MTDDNSGPDEQSTEQDDPTAPLHGARAGDRLAVTYALPGDRDPPLRRDGHLVLLDDAGPALDERRRLADQEADGVVAVLGVRDVERVEDDEPPIGTLAIVCSDGEADLDLFGYTTAGDGGGEVEMVGTRVRVEAVERAAGPGVL